MEFNDHLDPEDWDQVARYLADFTADEINELAASIRSRVWQPVPDAVKRLLADESVPIDKTDLDEVIADYRQYIRPYRNGNTHPRYFGWVQGTGTLPALIADIAISSMNSNSGGRDHGAVYIERQVVEWCKQIFQFPAQAAGLMTSGTSASNHLALQVAIFHKLGLEQKHKGFFNVGQPLRCYTSVEGHSSIIKAIQTSGIGSDNLVVIDTDDKHRILIPQLQQHIERDRAMGYTPFMVIGNAGTVNTGAFDDFAAIRQVCDRFDCWMHVDGAFGAWLKIAEPKYAALTRGMELSDSLAFDFHKLMYVQYDCGGLLVRDGEFQQQVFSIRPNYLAPHGQALAGGEPWFCDYGMELSRSFRALKAWFTFKAYGLNTLGQAVSENCRLANKLGKLIKQSDYFKLAKKPVSNIVTFKMKNKHNGHKLGPQRNDQLCEQIVTRLQLSGEAVFSLTRQGKYRVIRASITNHRTRDRDIEYVVERLEQLAAELL